MKKLHHKNLQRQIKNLVGIVELCLPFIREINKTNDKLRLLPGELENLKKQLIFLEKEQFVLAAHSAKNVTITSQITEIEFKLDFLVDDLEIIFAELATFNDKINNIVVLKEKLEAVQEERLGSLTPELIYKLLERQEARSQNENFLRFSSNKIIEKKNKIYTWYSKINSKRKLKLGIVLSLIASLSLGCLVGYYSYLRLHENNANTAEEIER